MNGFYLATFVAVLVTISIASHLLFAGMRGSAASELLAGLRSQGIRTPDRVKRAFDHWVAAMLARRERQARMFALNRCTGREPEDVGLYRGNIAPCVRLSAGRRGVSGNISKLHSAGERL
jgi:hypothetical protein